MKISIVSLFPEFFDSFAGAGLMQKALSSGIVELEFFNPRTFTNDKRQTVDDRPYGGGPGMVMMLDPLVKSLLAAGHKPKKFIDGFSDCDVNLVAPTLKKKPRLLAMSPRGRQFNQSMAEELALEDDITLLCGRYEGFDHRLYDLFHIEEVSIGDFVLNGGEAAALNICEAVSRLIPGYMGHQESGVDESFSSGLLEYPHYTRPESYHGIEVPEVLRSGDHAAIDRWRRDEALLTTLSSRPKMLENTHLSAQDMQKVKSKERYLAGKNLYIGLVHYPVLDRDKKSVTVSLTNLDVHDIARSSCTYGLGGFFVVSPMEDHHMILRQVLGHWSYGSGAKRNPDRSTALSKVLPAFSVDDAMDKIEEMHGVKPMLLSSSAQGSGTITFAETQKSLYTHPALLLLGTGHGLAPEIMDRCDALVPPVRWTSGYNHLSVRSAAAIMLDRILGEWG